MKIFGKGSLEFKGKNFRVFVVLDPDSGHIIAKIPMIPNFDFLRCNDNEIFTKRHSIKKLKIELLHGAMECNDISNLYIDRISPGTLSIYDSFLVRSFGLYDEEIGVCTVSFIPKTPLLEFKCKTDIPGYSSELVFNKSQGAPTVNWLKFELNSQIITSVCSDKMLIVTAEFNLLPLREKICRALSILKGGRIVYRYGLFESTIQINFVGSDKPNCLGDIFRKDNDQNEFIEKYLEYEISLSGKSQNRHELFVKYFLEGMSANSNIENRFISLYTAMEIIDNSKTLSKQSISSVFGLNSNVSDIVVRFRNKLIHQGCKSNAALLESIREVEKNTSLDELPFKAAGRDNIESIYSYYKFLVTCLYRKIFRDIGFDEREIQLLA